MTRSEPSTVCGAAHGGLLHGVTVTDVSFRRGEPSHRIFVHRPSSPPPAAGWPVLYLTDGNAVFATARDALRIQASYPASTGVTEGVVVAVGYPVEGPYDPWRRSWELSPPPGQAYPPFSGTTAAVRTGGAAAFLDVLERDVVPWVEDDVPIDPTRRTLFGHSFGGLFALYALFSRPALFGTYVAASPALSWENEALRPFEDTFRLSTHGGRRRVLLSAGEYEGDALAPFQRGAPDEAERLADKRLTRTAASVRALADRLGTRHGDRLEVVVDIFAGETHMSVLPVALNRAVQAAFPARRGSPQGASTATG